MPPEGGAVQPAGGRRGFVLIHCDPQEILNLHDNYDPATFDYDGNGRYEAEDAWKALMDLVDLADSYGIPLTLQFSPPYIDFMRQPRCDRTLGAGRVYPAGTGTAYTTCRDLVMAWGANGHELSVHHHGPYHDPLKFDGYTNREVYAVQGKRACGPDDGPACGCDQGRCYWCAPPGSALACREYEGPPPGPVGIDAEWKGPIEGTDDSMMALVYEVFGERTIRSICLDHRDEIPDMPSDPYIIYTTQGTGYANDPAQYPMCIGYDVAGEYHAEPKFTWFYSHGFVFGRENLETLKATLRETASEAGYVFGIVFHVNDFLRSEHNPDDPRFGRTHRDLFAYLTNPDDGGGPVRMATLSDLMVEAGKTEAPDPCVDSCFTLDESSERASYTVPVPRPPNCPSGGGDG